MTGALAGDRRAPSIRLHRDVAFTSRTTTRPAPRAPRKSMRGSLPRRLTGLRVEPISAAHITWRVLKRVLRFRKSLGPYFVLELPCLPSFAPLSM